MNSTTFDLARTAASIAQSLQVTSKQVEQTINLLDDGNTIPFIARYRKEATQGLDEIQLRKIEDAAIAERELADRKRTILKTIEELGQLTDALKSQIIGCTERQLLEDIYLPFKPKRKTRAALARERGLQPLAYLLLKQHALNESPDVILRRFVSAERDVPTPETALAGACDIVAETWAENADLRQWMKERAGRGQFVSVVKRGRKKDGGKFEAWFDHSERVDRIPSHRFLAMRRGEAEGVLRLSIEPDEEYVLPRLEQRLIRNPEFEFAYVLKDTVSDCYKRLLKPAAESALLQQLRKKSEDEAIGVFACNIRELLLAPPAGPHVTMGIDPGFRTGCKVAVVDATGRFLENTTIYPTPPRNEIDKSSEMLLELISRHSVSFIAIGNGTGSRETSGFVAKLIKDNDLQTKSVVVSEAGASVYSASELAISEYPDLDVTVRGAISIAHRLQDPLSELVKIDPRAIGVGQYQHDVNQASLKQSLDREVESCVNSVGVDLNMASVSLLSYVAGIGPKLAKNIVQYRDRHGSFSRRNDLLNVPRLGGRAFEQAAGFLRIRDGKEPLDSSGVHPESYSVVSRMAQRLDVAPIELMGSRQLASQLSIAEFVTADAGEFTIRDIVAELSSPGRDPRSEFQCVTFAEDVEQVSDLAPGMKLDGVVTNVTHFGAFVDIGVHQDGLIHISQMADHFVKDPTQELSVGEIVRVTVLEVDESRGRISLSRKSGN